MANALGNSSLLICLERVVSMPLWKPVPIGAHNPVSCSQFLGRSCVLNRDQWQLFEVARRRLRTLPNVHLYNLDSRTFLSALQLPRQARTFFYLDAHWQEELPLADEAEFVIRNFDSFAIMVDDFEVTNDSGYSFDDYGPGKRLSLRDFPFHTDNRICPYFPARQSSQESGICRGCIVLVSRDLKTKVDSLDCLRPVQVGP